MGTGQQQSIAVLRARALGRDFYCRPVLTVARDCIGKVLVHQHPQGLVAGRIVEAEAYRGPEDRAAHSYGGRRTPRTEVMFGHPGRAYVFLIYGMHWNFNLVTTAEGKPHAVLIRAVEPLLGVESMRQRRAGAPSYQLTNGPGKVCQAFGIDRSAYGEDLCGSRLFLSEGHRGAVHKSARVGVEYAGQWASKPWRFFEANNPWVSRGKPSGS